MKIIDFRFRPHTENILRGLAESPIFRDSLIASGLDLDEFVAGAKTVPQIAQEVRQAGITKACLIGRDAETTYDYKPNNEELKGFVQEAPDLFLAFAGLDPHKGMDSVYELEDRVKKDGFVGAATDPIYNKLPVDAAEFFPIYSKCCELNVPIVITTGPARFTQGTAASFAHPDQIDRVANFFPELKIIVSHGAWPYVNEMIGVSFRNKNVWMEASEYEGFPQGQAYIEAAKGILKDRFVFASAHPFVHYQKAIDLYQTFGFDDATLERVMYKNAAQALGLED
jgi:predicted TIM-barrel fold metal-dependent hydrolase